MTVPNEGVMVRISPQRSRWTDFRISKPNFSTMVVLVLALIGVAGLFARIQSYPLRHDEQFYIPSGILFTPEGLYRDFGYNQPPNLPIILHMVFQATGTSHFLLTGRLLIFAAWLLTCALIALIAARASGSRNVAIFCVALFVLNPVLLGSAGMMVTNSFLPIPFALLGLHCFLLGNERGEMISLWSFVSGCAAAFAMGFKANYIFLPPVLVAAALVMPAWLSFRERLTKVLLPLAAGLALGAAPSLIYFLPDPDAFLAHAVRYHSGAQIGYWMTVGNVDDSQAITFAQKMMLAGKIWVMSAGGAITLSLLFLGALRWLSATQKREADRRLALMLVFALIACGIVVSFIPTPGFPQYYVPPIPFAVVAVAMLYGRLAEARRVTANRGLMAIGLVLVLIGAPRLLVDLPRLAHPERWSAVVLHRQALALANETAGDARPIATLAPLYPLEAKRPIYPELAAGFVLYRVGDYLRRTEGAHYRYLASPTTIGQILEQRRPSAILLGTEPKLDATFATFARTHGYVLSPTAIADQRNGALQLYLSPRSNS